MRKLIWTALIAVGVSMQASAANSDDYAPEFRAYTSFSFGAPQAQSLGLHYGLRVDHDSREQSLLGSHKPAIAQVDFSSRSGFESARIYGMPLTAPTYQMNLIGQDSTWGRMLWFGGWFALGGIIYGIHEWTHGGSTPAPANGGGGGGGGG